MRLTGKNLKLVEADLFGRLPYGVICQVSSESPIQLGDGTEGSEYEEDVVELTARDHDQLIDLVQGDWVLDIKPYLRPMSNMTEHERIEFREFINWQFDCDYQANTLIEVLNGNEIEPEYMVELFEWLNEHRFDYRNLIDKELALEAPKDMYNF